MKVRAKRADLVRLLGEREQRVALHDVDLVQDQHALALGRKLGKPFEDGAVLVGQPLARIDQERDHVGVGRAAPGGRHHGALEPPLRRKDAGRVDEDDLRVVRG